MAVNLRKRSRSGDDCEDCMPISKRINGLHIRYSTEEKQQGQGFNNNIIPMPESGDNYANIPASSSYTCPSNDTSPPQQYAENSSLSKQQPEFQSSQQHASAQGLCNNIIASGNENTDFGTSAIHNGATSSALLEELEAYQPELSSNDNPHYYEINQVLFNVHKEKVLRSHEDG